MKSFFDQIAVIVFLVAIALIFIITFGFLASCYSPPDMTDEEANAIVEILKEKKR